jgi:hypothetical protein
MVAVGVADTGPGLSEGVLRSAESGISTSDSKTTAHGAYNTGFGLFHAHLRRKPSTSSTYPPRVNVSQHAQGGHVGVMAGYQGVAEDVDGCRFLLSGTVPLVKGRLSI